MGHPYHSALPAHISGPDKAMCSCLRPTPGSISEPLVLRSQENVAAWERRMFGGAEEDVDGANLRGAMMDVVVSLFGGVDYDDALC